MPSAILRIPNEIVDFVGRAEGRTRESRADCRLHVALWAHHPFFRPAFGGFFETVSQFEWLLASFDEIDDQVNVCQVVGICCVARPNVHLLGVFNRVWRLSALLHFYNQKCPIGYIARHHRRSRQDRRIDILEADILHGEGELFPGRRLKPFKRGLWYAVNRVDPNDEHAAVRICERRDDLRELLADVRVSFVFDP